MYILYRHLICCRFAVIWHLPNQKLKLPGSYFIGKVIFLFIYYYIYMPLISQFEAYFNQDSGIFLFLKLVVNKIKIKGRGPIILHWSWVYSVQIRFIHSCTIWEFKFFILILEMQMVKNNKNVMVILFYLFYFHFETWNMLW